MNRLRSRLAPILLALAVLGVPRPGHAQTRPAPTATPVVTPTAAPLAPAQARAALDVLTDDAARAKLIAVLQAIAQTQPAPNIPAPAPATPAPATPATPATAIPVIKPPAIVLAPNSVGAQLLVGLSERIANLSAEAEEVADTVTDFPLLWHWMRQLATDRQMQRAILNVVWRLAVVLGLGLFAEWGVRRLLDRPLARIRAKAPASLWHPDPDVEGIADAEAGHTEWTRRRAGILDSIRLLPFVLVCFCLDLVSVVAVIATTYLLLGFGLAGGLTSRLVILAVMEAYVALRIMVSITRAVVSPASDRLRLIPIGDDSAAVVVHDVALLGGVAVAGYAIAEAALLFGLYLAAHDALLKLNALIVYVLVVRIVLRNRRGLKNALRARDGAHGAFAALRNVLATAWHRVIIFYLGALWLVWAFDIEDGFSRLLRVMISTVLVAGGSRLATLAARSLLDRVLQATEGVDEHYPGMEQRLVAYYPALRAGVNVAIAVVSVGVLFEAWGYSVLTWFEPAALGARMVSALTTIVATLILALVVWEFTNAAIARHLAQLARNAQLARSARLRTLLPMFRTTLLVTVSLIAGLVILSEIGVNIAPLLAGAGVIGLAIGFGSQKLVQDIITGLFLLLENAMQVGDVVSLGGMSGTVENLSIRTIRLRALDGAVHIVPFSAVTTVTNNTRDYGFAVLDVSVGLNEEPDRIADVLKAVAEGLRAEAPWRGFVLADLEVMGVEKFIDTAWVMRVRLKTLPANRWAVGRELNRRIKYRFDELAIESPITSYHALSMAQPLFAPDTSDKSDKPA